MHLIVQAAILGLLTGGVYALMASGLTLAFGVMRVINVAQGEKDRESMLRYLDGILAIEPTSHEERWVRAVFRFQSDLRDGALPDRAMSPGHRRARAGHVPRAARERARPELRDGPRAARVDRPPRR